MRLRLLIVFLAATAVCQARQACGQTTRHASGEPLIRLHKYYLSWGSWPDVADKYPRKDDAIGFEYLRANERTDTMTQARDLVAGKVDVILVCGPVTAQPGADGKPLADQPDLLMSLLKEHHARISTLGIQPLGIVVHPSNALDSIDEAALGRIINGQAKSWKELGGQDLPVTAIALDPAWTVAKRFRPEGFAGKTFRSFDRLDALLAVASAPGGVGLVPMSRRVANSGLKVLAVRPAAGRPAVLPTAANVRSGAYPYNAYLAVAMQADASKAATVFWNWVVESRMDGGMDSAWSLRLDYSLAEGPAAALAWPAPAPDERPPDIDGAAAVLPLKPLAAELLLANTADYAGYEAGVYAGLARRPVLKIVDREQLAKVLAERLAGADRGGAAVSTPIVAADVLVMPATASEDGHAWLQIHAYHAPTAALLGWIRLPIDPAGGAERLSAEVERYVADWWPGVLRNLVSARDRQVVTVLPASADKPGDYPRALLIRNAVREMLQEDRRVFFTDYVELPAAQRELLLKLLGLSRPTAGRYSAAADFIVDVGWRKNGLCLRVVSGRDLAAIRETALPSGTIDHLEAAARRWLDEQLATLPKPAGPDTADLAVGKDETANRRQAASEMERGDKLATELRAFEEAAYNRYRRQDKNNYLPEDRKRIEQLQDQIAAHYSRAAQLDPSLEKAAFEAAMLECRGRDGIVRDYAEMEAAAQAAGQFADTFPRSKKVGKAQWEASYYHHTLARLLSDNGLTERAKVPQSVDRAKAAIEHRRLCLRYLAQHVNLRLTTGDMSSSYEFNSFMGICYQSLADYQAMGVDDKEMERAIAEYGRAADAHADRVRHSDLFRLQLYANRAGKDAFLQLLGQMQKRWPDPDKGGWPLIRDDVVQLISDLYSIDRRTSGFYRWLGGKGEPGILP